jgi:glutamine amidotransferase
MCRHLGYLGSPRRLSELVLDPPHSLRRQSFAPARMRGGATLNADGFGIGWWSGGEAARYRRSDPLWTDANVGELCRATRVTAAVAAVRSATPGMPLSEGACAPFTDGHWLFSHNGVIAGWPASVAPLAKRLPIEELLTLPAATDSALLWAVLRSELRRGAEPGQALASLVAEVAALAPQSRLNLLLGDGERLYATVWRHSLSVLDGDDATVIASEPYDDDPRWESLADDTLVVADGTFLTREQIGH